MTAPTFPVRVRVALVAVLLFAILSDARLLRRAIPLHRQPGLPDEVTQAEARLRPLKQLLPRQGVVGYVADPRHEEGPLPDFAYARRFYLTRYSLTPLLVIDSSSAELVVGNFRGQGAVASPTEQLILERDLGEGIALFRRRPQ